MKLDLGAVPQLGREYGSVSSSEFAILGLG